MLMIYVLLACPPITLLGIIIVYSMYGFVTFVCIFIFVDLCYNENNSFLKIILFSYLYE